jgi:hypothetical protein
MVESRSSVVSWRPSFLAVAVLLACGFGAQKADAQRCIGDCDGDRSVAVNELVVGINIASGMQDPGSCPAFGTDPGIADLVSAVGNGLEGCPACDLFANSSVLLSTQLGDIGPLAMRGQLGLDCEAGGGDRECSCTALHLDPIAVVGVGFVCLTAATGCPDGVHSCEGGVNRNIDLIADHNIGDCTGNEDCDEQCQAYCAAIGSSPTTSNRGCEGFCTLDNDPCDTDLECAQREGGSCTGPDNVPFGNICECQCVDVETGDPGPPGTFACQLGTNLVVEIAAPCDRQDVLITVGSSCIPLTTQRSDGVIVNANNVPGNELLPMTSISAGVPISCETFDAGNVSGLQTRGSVAFFGSAIGDILTTVRADCE